MIPHQRTKHRKKNFIILISDNGNLLVFSVLKECHLMLGVELREGVGDRRGKEMKRLRTKGREDGEMVKVL